MVTLTVRNLDEDLVKRLSIRAAEHGRSAEAEHRGTTLTTSERHATREQATSRLAEFRRRTEGRGSSSLSYLLQESRGGRAEYLAGKGI